MRRSGAPAGAGASLVGSWRSRPYGVKGVKKTMPEEGSSLPS
jgi:hypothetical protein